MSKINVVTKAGELMWATVNGAGKKDLNGNDIFSVDIKLSHNDAEPLVSAINELWEEHKPKGAKDPKSVGYKEVEDGVVFSFKTKTTLPSGDAKDVPIYNAKAQRIDFTDKIGNGSTGCVAGVAAIYDAGVAARGVTLFLSSVQLINLIKYEAGAGFEEQEGEFVGYDDNDDGFVAQAL